ncbi:Palmitoyltransferase PFA4 [Spathaspora passalidarum NRRL Y-27907]|uniref:Palmitoyltransferase PFA4 n=1 Tax=Spathaspora passalidarum (strain NRRL Y-27907 / 11-Y1) TaxID=619300 RepID=G3AVJ2_SPAPN|nr:Palmitoyltransferase PFA4 [Spathaspora passalidarum NRRL Y-27907]EGW29941.1 Palmitoyltransferase PFA4 [Spathaspora passalidarum NRRL Y-27907]
MIQLKWPILGVIIPSIIIAVLGYGSHYFVLQHHLSFREQMWFEFYVTMVWISYLLAIITSPGTPPSNYKPPKGEWKRYCKKCNNFKPPRTHHCKVCNACVLQMDHHCPWTYNCVGYGNLPHFLRFLGWTFWTTSYLFVLLCQRIYSYYEQADLPIYLISKTEMAAVIFLTPIDFFICFSQLVLLIRVFGHIFKGMTQIETWEWERIDSQFYSEHLWETIRSNYSQLHGKEMPKLVSWSGSSATIARQLAEQEIEANEEQEQEFEIISKEPSDESLIPKEFTMDDMVFPYDLGFFKNLTNALGYPWMWLLPFAGPNSDGVVPEKSEEYQEEDQLNLPWPPDGGSREHVVKNTQYDYDKLKQIRNYQELRKRLDPRLNMQRNEWMDHAGSTLDDFGVDIEVEQEESLEK